MFGDFAELSISLLLRSSIQSKEVTNRFLKIVVYKIHSYFIGYDSMQLFNAILFTVPEN